MIAAAAYLQKWNLSDPHLLAETFTSTVYKVRHDGSDAVLKILNDIGREDEKGGAVALSLFDGHGAVRLLAHDEGAHLLEYAGGGDLSAMVRAGKDDEATEIIARVMNQLHKKSGPGQPPGLVPLERRFASLFDHAAQSEDALYAKASAAAEKLLATQKERCVLHGDIHHENIRASSRGWLAIDPKGLWGERAFDAANVFLNPQMPDIVLNEARFLKIADILSERMDIDRDRLLAYAFSFACLSAAWSLEDGQDPSLALAGAQIAQKHLRI